MRRRLPFPLVSDLKSGSRADRARDALAGLTTAIMLIPQGMAYALLAGLPPVTGLYAGLVPPLGYALLGTSRELSVGPVATDSLLVLSAISALSHVAPDQYPVVAAVFALLVGSFQVLMGGLRLGYLVNFLSQPVLSGFTSAAAVLIALSQVAPLLGLPRTKGNTAVTMTQSLLSSARELSLATVLVGALSIVFLVLQRRYAKRAPGALLTIGLGALLSKLPGLAGQVASVGDVPRGLPALRWPPLELALLEQLWPSALVLALVGFTESVAVGRVYSKRGKYALFPDRELVALGAANCLAGFFQGYPVAGGFSRTAVNAEAGARSMFSVLVSSGLVALTLLFLTPLFAHVPKTSLAAIIVVAVFGLVEVRQVSSRFRIRTSDGALLLLTFLSTVLFGIMPGLLLGMGASLLWFVVRTTRPHLAVLGRVPGTHLFKNVQRYPGLITYDDVLIVRMDAQLYFANAEYLRDQLLKLESLAKAPLSAVILDATSINQLDSSATELLEELDTDYRERGITLYLSGVKGPVRDVLERAGLWAKMKGTVACLSIHEALEIHNAKRSSPPGVSRMREAAPTI